MELLLEKFLLLGPYHFNFLNATPQEMDYLANAAKSLVGWLQRMLKGDTDIETKPAWK